MDRSSLGLILFAMGGILFLIGSMMNYDALREKRRDERTLWDLMGLLPGVLGVVVDFIFTIVTFKASKGGAILISIGGIVMLLAVLILFGAH